MNSIEQEITGLPMQTQLFGGFRRSDVTDYIKNLVDQIEAERAELKKEKEQIYDLMEKSKVFCDSLIAESRKKADETILDAQKKADEMLQEAGKELERIHEDRQLMLAQSQAEAKKLVSIIARQQQESANIYDELLRPAAKLLRALGGGQDAT